MGRYTFVRLPLPANSNTYRFGFILLLILHRLAALAPLPVDCWSIMTRDWLVFYSSLNFGNFRYLYNDIVLCKAVMVKSNRIESFSSLANRPSLLPTHCSLLLLVSLSVSVSLSLPGGKTHSVNLLVMRIPSNVCFSSIIRGDIYSGVNSLPLFRPSAYNLRQRL